MKIKDLIEKLQNIDDHELEVIFTGPKPGPIGYIDHIVVGLAFYGERVVELR